MSFADPAVVTINSVAKSLVRIKQDGYSSEYLLRTSTEEYRMQIRNSSYYDKKRSVDIDRHNIELVHTVFPVAPATLAVKRKVYAVIENQKGDTLSDPTNVASGLLAYLTASSNANISKMMNLES
jgi:hypothetical protein